MCKLGTRLSASPTLVVVMRAIGSWLQISDSLCSSRPYHKLLTLTKWQWFHENSQRTSHPWNVPYTGSCGEGDIANYSSSCALWRDPRPREFPAGEMPWPRAKKKWRICSIKSGLSLSCNIWIQIWVSALWNWGYLHFGIWFQLIAIICIKSLVNVLKGIC